MILFLYGFEAYLLREKLQQVITKAKTQDAAVVMLDDESELAAIREAMQGSSLFASKQLIVIRDLLSRPAAEVSAILEAAEGLPEGTILAVAEFGEPDKRTIGFKQLGKLAEKTWHFDPLDNSGAQQWVQRWAKENAVSVQPAATQELISRAGTDIWTLSTELEKLSAAQDTVTVEQVAALVAEELPADIFQMVDALGQRDAKTVVTHLHRLLDEGEPLLRIFAMVIRQFRLLLQTSSLLGGGVSPNELPKRLGTHPFVARKVAAQAKHFTEHELRDIYARLADLDFGFKSGKSEPEAALELFVVELCGAQTVKNS